MKFFKPIIFNGLKFEKRNLEKIKGIESLFIPNTVSIPIYKKQGGIFVSIGEKVYEGQAIGSSDEGMDVHSSIPGIIEDIKDRDINGYTFKNIDIKLFGEFDISGKRVNNFDWQSLKKETVIDILKSNGVDGFKKDYHFLSLLKKTMEHTNLENLIINGFDLDFSTFNSLALIKFKAQNIFEGIKILIFLLEPKKTIFVIDNDYIDHISQLKKLIDSQSSEIELKFVNNTYPKSNDFLLYKFITKNSAYCYDEIVEQNSFIADLETTYLVYDALKLQKPMIEKLVTINNGSETKVCNVKIGKSIINVIQESTFVKNNTKVISGGVILGGKLSSIDNPITKDTNSIIITDNQKDKEVSCIKCNICIKNCPVALEPIKLYQLIKQNKEIANKNDLRKCIDCKLCDYLCPSNIPLSSSIQKSKHELLYGNLDDYPREY